MAIGADIPSHLENVWVYLRKSREDREAEERAQHVLQNEIETLSRHRRTLLELAKRYSHSISCILEEVVSGEFISERPEMIRLLNAVGNEEVTAVWVMDLDRLGRGDMADQGIILRTFKDSGTLILTPDKVYDLGNEMDEEWTEFKTFFARRELKMISKRMQRGRIAAVKEGKYIGSRPPFGYDITKDLILVPNDSAQVVKQIFDLYVNHGFGCNRIAHHLNTLGIQTAMGRPWRGETILAILKNSVYVGWIVWKKIKHDKRRGTYRQRPKDEWIAAKGQHEPLIDELTFKKATQIRTCRAHTPVNRKHSISNPLAGLIECGMCGDKLVKRPYTKQAPHLICKNPNCPQKSTRLSIVEDRLVEALSIWLDGYLLTKEELIHSFPSLLQETLAHKKLLCAIDERMTQIEQQKDNLHNLVERGIYDGNTYFERAQKLKRDTDCLSEYRERVMKQVSHDEKIQNIRFNLVSEVIHILKAYRNTEDVSKRNLLLKSILQKVIYNKEKWQRNDQLELTLFLNV